MSRRAVLVVVALVVAALSTALLTVYVRGADARALQGTDLVSVLVASEEIPAGRTGQEILDQGLVTRTELPESAVEEGALNDIPEELREQRLSASVLAGEQLRRERFEEQSASRLAIPEGLMAVSVDLGDPARVAGNVEPSSDVAVFVTLESGGSQTKLLLPRVIVLDTGIADATDDATGASLLTLAVTQAEAQELIQAQSSGELYVALLEDASQVGSQPPTTDADLGP